MFSVHGWFVKISVPLMQKKTIAKYEVDSAFAVGPSSESFKARSLDGKGWVVIKVFSKIPHLDEFELESFKQRFKKISALKNSGLAHIYSAGKRSNDDPYVVTRFIEGASLYNLCRSGLSSAEILSFFYKIAITVGFLHKLEVQHGNLKLSNVIISSKQKQPFLIDFSLLERSTRQPSTRSDSFLFAVMLYEALMGKLPFGVNSYEAITAYEISELNFNELDNRYGLTVGRVFKKAFSADGEQYYPSLNLLVKDVDDAIALSEEIKDGRGRKLSENNPPVIGGTQQGPKHHPLVYVVSLLIPIAIATVLFFVFFKNKDNQEFPFIPEEAVDEELLKLANEAALSRTKTKPGTTVVGSASEGDVKRIGQSIEFSKTVIPSNLSTDSAKLLTNAQLLYILKSENMNSKALALAITEVADRGGKEFYSPLQLLAVHNNYNVRGSVALALKHDDYLRKEATFMRLQSLLHDEEPLVRGHAAKSLGKLQTDEARKALSMRLGIEKQQLVIKFIKSALGLEE